jgi:ribose/xylose/arabinose/galactoside ABC-type transport system permease subunit
VSASLEPIEARAKPVARPPESAIRRFVDANRAALGTLAVFVVMIAIFMVASPTVFLHWPIYDSVLVTLPVALCLVAPLVFVVTVGEIDLSFPATMGFSAWMFALVVHAGLSPFLGIVAALATGMILGACVGALVVTAGLSSLIATLGMNFMLRGFITIVTQGKSIALLDLQDSTAATLFSSEVYGVPVQIFWALAFVIFAWLLFNHHTFGARVCAVGDNPDSAGQMGINVARVRILTFVFVGLGAALAGVFSTMVQLHLVADDRRRLSSARDRLGFRRRNADLGRRRHDRRRGDRRADGVLHSERHRRRGFKRILRPVLQRPHHHSGAARPSMEPEALSVGQPRASPLGRNAMIGNLLDEPRRQRRREVVAPAGDHGKSRAGNVGGGVAAGGDSNERIVRPVQDQCRGADAAKRPDPAARRLDGDEMPGPPSRMMAAAKPALDLGAKLGIAGRVSRAADQA